MTSRVATIIAVASGIAFGTTAALVGPGSDAAPAELPPGAHPPFAPIAARARVVDAPPPPPQLAPLVPSASSAAAESALLAASAEPAEYLPPWKRDPLASGREEAVTLSCAQGDADECMRLGVFYLGSNARPPDEKQARLFLGQARRLFAATCEKRSPSACVSLALIHREAIGMPRNPEAAEALVERASMLCKINPDSSCGGSPRTSDLE